MIAFDILALLLPLILASRHPETTCGACTTASCKYLTTLYPYRSECYNRRMRGKYSRITTMKNRKKGYATRGLPRRSPILVLLSPKHASLQGSDGIRCFSTGMIASDIPALLLPHILAPRHPETTHGPRATASCKYFTTPHPYRSECYNRRMHGKYSRIIKKRECNTRTSQEVTHPSTTHAQARLTSEY